MLERIERFIVDRARTGQRTLLIVDEVQNLPLSSLEELRMLSNFQAKEQAMLQIFLLGQPEFRDRLANSDQLEQLRQRVIATHHLTAMDANEVGPYIEHRLKLVGWSGAPRFDASAYGAIFTQTGGVPRRINTLMTRVLLLASLDKAPLIDAALIAAVVADLSGENPASLIAQRVQAVAVDSEPPVLNAADDQTDDQPLDLAARFAVLEAKSEEQEAALRRVLGLLVDWVERDEAVRSGYDFKQNTSR